MLFRKREIEIIKFIKIKLRYRTNFAVARWHWDARNRRFELNLPLWLLLLFYPSCLLISCPRHTYRWKDMLGDLFDLFWNRYIFLFSWRLRKFRFECYGYQSLPNDKNIKIIYSKDNWSTVNFDFEMSSNL